MNETTIPRVAPGDEEISVLGPFLSAASFQVPQRLIASPWLEHAPFAGWLIEAQRPDTLVELGTNTGFSYFVFCETVKRNGLSTRCWAIDTWTGDAQSGRIEEDVFIRMKAYHDPRYAGFSQLVRATSEAALPQFADRSVDLLHIDGQQRYEDVAAVFSSWVPKLSARAVVLFHDTAVREGDFGVHRLWAEMSAQYPHFEFKHGSGLGVLGCGPSQASRLAALFAIADDAGKTELIQRAYERLGGAISDASQKAAARLEAEAANRARTDAARLRGENESLRKTLAGLVINPKKKR